MSQLCDNIIISPLVPDVNTFFAFLQFFYCIFATCVVQCLYSADVCTEFSPNSTAREKRFFIMTLGEKIKARRIELSLSVDEVAEKIGRNRATVYRYENSDIGDIPTGVLETLAKALLTTPAELMGWEDDGLSARDRRDIAQTMEQFIAQLGDPKQALMFDGEPLDEESRDLLLASLENSLKLGKMMAKNKFTPDKYKK